MNVKSLLRASVRKGDNKYYKGELYTPCATEEWFSCLASIPSRKKEYYVYQWSLINGTLFLNCRSKEADTYMSVYDLCNSCADRKLKVKIGKKDLIDIQDINEDYCFSVKKWYIENHILYIKQSLFF